MLVRFIIILAVIFFTALIALISGSRLFLSCANDSVLKLGLVLFTAFLECTVAFSLKIIGKNYISFVLWGMTIFSMILFLVISSRSYKHVKTAVDYFNKYPEHKDIADKLFVGFSNFGTGVPGKQYRKERKIYGEGIDAFIKLELPENDEEIILVQRKFRRTKIAMYFLITMMIVWFLQVPVILFVVW